MNKVIIGIIGISFIFCAAGSALFAQGDELALNADEAIVLFLSGDVKVKGAASPEWSDAEVGMVLSSGERVKTGKSSWAEIGFGAEFRSIVKVDESTTLQLIDLGAIKIGLLDGEIRTLIENLDEGSTFQVETPSAVCGARGTGWDTKTNGKKMTVDAFEEKVFFSKLDGSEETTITAGKRGTLASPIKSIKIESLPKSRMRDWDKWKKDVRGRITSERSAIVDKANKIRKGPLAPVAPPIPPEGVDRDMRPDNIEPDVTRPGPDDRTGIMDKPDIIKRTEGIHEKMNRIERIEEPQKDIKSIKQETRQDISGEGGKPFIRRRRHRHHNTSDSNQGT
ncbi:MAG: FecR domain-containing protein [Candidatus Omnitrophota bacterium]